MVQWNQHLRLKYETICVIGVNRVSCKRSYDVLR